MDGYFRREKELRQRLQEGMTVDEYLVELDLIQSMYKDDLKVAESRAE
ncbi:Unknown protein sequence [Pseudomonas savastanoi pv. retacarpa]|nr:Unknown protein sequence [Pseudomonas savastanoi pv. retacarpa]RML30041.1 hypothetical protein ALR00_00990 [Pseudomonas savastanoi pv. retacarpa]RMP46111.1 hypothetical protein ALQ22_200195 [Pseudomonas savastanoi pv. retacarpa]